MNTITRVPPPLLDQCRQQRNNSCSQAQPVFSQVDGARSSTDFYLQSRHPRLLFAISIPECTSLKSNATDRGRGTHSTQEDPGAVSFCNRRAPLTDSVNAERSFPLNKPDSNKLSPSSPTTCLSRRPPLFLQPVSPGN